MSKPTAVQKIEITIQGKTLVLTPDEAKELRDVPGEIYPPAPKYVPVPYSPPVSPKKDIPDSWPGWPRESGRYVAPYKPWHERPRIWWEVTCRDNHATLCTR